MKYFLIIFLAFSFQALAQSEEKVCAKLVKAVRQPDGMESTASLVRHSRILKNLLKHIDGLKEKYPSKEALLKYCEEQLEKETQKNLTNKSNRPEKELTESASSVAAASGLKTSLSVKEETEVVSNVEDCSVFESLFCLSNSAIEVGVLNPMFKIAHSLLTMEERLCGCTQEKAKEIFHSSERIEEEKNKRKTELIDSINDEFGKKFINQYAAHLEEVNYFATNSKYTFGKDDSSQSRKLEAVSCSDSKRYEKAVDSKCKNKISAQDKLSKYGEVFSLLNLNNSNKPKDYFESLNEKISKNSIEGKGQSGSKAFSRHEFDSARGALVKEDRVFLFINDFMSKLTNDKFAMSEIQKEIDSGDIPMVAIYRYLYQYQVPSIENQSKYLDKSVMGDELYELMSSRLRDDTLLPFLVEKFDYSMQIHPGLNNILHNSENFLKAYNKSQGKGSILDALKDESIMGDVFQKRCDQLVSDFAEFICASEEDKIAGLGKPQLAKLNSRLGKDKEGKVITGLLMCESNTSNENPKSGAFSFLLRNPAQVKSDTLERILQPDSTKHENLFSRLMLKSITDPDSSPMNFVRNATNNSYNPSAGVGRDVFGKKFRSHQKNASFLNQYASKDSASPSSVTEVVSGVNASLQNNESTQTNNAIGSGYTNSNMPSSNAAGTNSETKFDIKSDLKEYFSNESRTSLSDIKDANDHRLDEIWKLKEENAKFRAQLLEVATENERLKLKGLEDQVNELKRRNGKEAQAKVNEAHETENYVPSPRPVIRNAASYNSDQGSAFAKPVEANGNATNNSNRNSAGSATLSDLKSSLSSDALNAKYSSTPVVVTASGSHSAGLEIKSTELASELLKYITASETDVQTLEKIKNSGMVYKYKVLENGTYTNKEIVINYQNLDEKVRQVLDQRLASNNDKKSQSLKRSYSYEALKIIFANSKR